MPGVSTAPAKIVMLTTFGEDEYLYEALRLGTSGFLLKVAPPEQLLQIDPAVTRWVIEVFSRSPGARPAPPELEELTPRELEVLQLLARGLSNAEIATALIVSLATVKTHVNRILLKLGLRDRTQAAVLAYEAGIVRPGQQP